MITADQAFDRLVEACPSYWAADGVDEYVASFEDEDTPDLFVRMSAFAHHLVALAAAGRTDDLVPVFHAVEDLLEGGDDDAVELVKLGLLEVLQNICSHADVLVDAAVFEPLLGPRALAAWTELDELWTSAGTWPADDTRVDEDDYRRIVDPRLRWYYQAHKRRMPDGLLISAADIVRYQTDVANLSPVFPAGRPRVPWPAVVVGIVLAVAVALALYR